MFDKNSKIYIAGHRGLAGSAILASCEANGYSNIIIRTHAELDLTDNQAVENFFKTEKPEFVFVAAARVGGIHANNTFRAEFIYQNLQIQNNLIHFSKVYEVKKLLFLGSSCIYPKYAPQPLKEEYLLDGKLEPSNQPYAIAKIAGIEMCKAYRDQYGCNFICAMPTNLYGTNDNFHLENAHVLPAMIHKMHLAKTHNKGSVELWGTGKPYREFMHSSDLGDACVYLMKTYNDPEIVNIGCGEDVSIRELAELIKKVIGFNGELIFNSDKPDGSPRKLLDVTRINQLGWKSKVKLEEGLKNNYEWFLDNFNDIRKR
jgi:GDP-L-fucose synthase